MDFIFHNGEKIYYFISKKGTKNLYARMDENNVVRVSAPYFISKKVLEGFVVDSYHKLLKKKQKKNDKIINDGMIKVMGVVYNIEEIEDLNYLLSSKLKQYIRGNYLEICKRMSISNPPSIVFKKVKGYLGQYNKKNHRITLNVLIGHLSVECVEYVIIHELAHIKYMNHQQEFWKEIEHYLPNYRKIRNQCKKEFVYYENY